MSHFENLVNFYNDLMKNIFDDSSEFYTNLNEQQKNLCKHEKLRIVIIIQNNISKKYFKGLFQKYFSDKIKTDDIMIFIKEITKINSNENFINFIKNFQNIKNNFVKKSFKKNAFAEFHNWRNRILEIEPEKIFPGLSCLFLLDKNGGVFATGDNTRCKLGTSKEKLFIHEFLEVPFPSSIVDIKCGNKFTIFLDGLLSRYWVCVCHRRSG